MAQPTGYTPVHPFVSDSAVIPNFPGQALDIEFNAVKSTTDQIRANLALIQRDDGQPANGIVTYDTLSPALQTNGLATAAAWLSGVNYVVGTTVYQNSSLYRCLITHTSGSFATDLAAARWLLLVALPIGPQGIQGPIGNTGATGGTGNTGATGAGYGGTSATSLLIANSVTKVFTTQAGLAYLVGDYVRAKSAANGVNYMEGNVSAYSGTSLSIAVTAIGGSGTFADWQINQSGAPGAPSGVTTLNAQSGALALIVFPQGRLTAVTAVAIPTTDQSAVTVLYYTAGQAPISDGTNIIPNVSPQLSMALDPTAAHTGYHQSGKNFDVFKFNDSGTIRIGTGPTWNSGAVAGSDTARGTGAGSTDIQFLGNTGIQVNTNSIVLRWGSASGNTTTVAANQAVYLGTFRTTADGQFEDSMTKRFLWNAYNQAQREMRRVETTASWNYSTSGFRQANANAANQIECVLGQSGGQVEAELMMTASSSTATIRPVNCAVALDAVTVTDGAAYISASSTLFGSVIHKYRGLPTAGYHKLCALESGGGADIQTWYGNDAFRLYGSVWA